MKIKTRYALVVSLLSPLPLVAGLALASGVPPTGGYWVVTLLGVCSSLLLLAASFRSKGVEFSVEGWGSLGSLTAASGVILYLLGSYFGWGFLQWVSILVLYDGLVLYLGGESTLELVLPSSLVLASLALPPNFLPEVVASVLFLGGILAPALALLRKPTALNNGCQDCAQYAERKSSYCLRCGKRLSPLLVSFPYGKIAKVATITVLLLLASVISVQALAFANGTPASATYKMSGAGSSLPLVADSGWSVMASTTTVGGTTVGTYNLTKSHESVAVSLALSTSRTLAEQAISGPYPELRQAGSVSLGDGLSAQLLEPMGNSTVKALSWDSTVDFVNGTAVEHFFISYLAWEDVSSKSVNGTGLYSVTQHSLTSIGGIRGWDWFTSGVVGNWYANSTYVGAGGAVFLLGLPFEASRRLDSRKSREVENSLGLSPTEFRVLAGLARDRKGRTGFQAVDSIAASGVLYDWYYLEPLLLRLEGLGLVRRKIRKISGYPTLLWECRVG